MKDRYDMSRLSVPQARGEVFSKFARIPDIQIIYVSALACTRHRGPELVALQRKGILSFLLFEEIDMITGDYIEKTRQAAAEIAEERKPSGIILMTGCQSVLLSTDFSLLTREIEEHLGIPIRVHDGCRLCGFDEAESGGATVDRLLYDFILPSEKSVEKSVNILGIGEFDENSELFSILKNAGVEHINMLDRCKTREDYQHMGTAKLNILTSAKDIATGEYLEEKLGIPWVCLGGVYSPDDLTSAYEKLGSVLGTQVDVSSLKAQLVVKLSEVKVIAAGRSFTVDDDAELARWLLGEGFAVSSLRLNPHNALTAEQRKWFAQNAPDFHIESLNKGGHGGPPEGHGGHGGPPEGHGGHGRPGAHEKPASILLGFYGSMRKLDLLRNSVGGAER